MNSIKLSMTAPSTVASPSRFAMPTSGRAFGVSTVARAASIQGTTVSAAVAPAAVVRERQAIAGTATDGHMGFGKSYLPGTSAWRPPVC